MRRVFHRIPRLWLFHRRLMASHSPRKDHIDVTANQSRHKITSSATVVEAAMISPSVKFLTLSIHHPSFIFKAGQWVDFIVPGMNKISGYSICSSIKQLEKEGKINLAIKQSDHPVASWVHEECQKGSEVNVRVGGDFYYDPKENDIKHTLLLVAGGVGINPIISIFGHAAGLYEKYPTAEWIPKQIHLLYSAKDAHELIFKDKIENICTHLPEFKCKYFITKSSANAPAVNIKHGRMNEKDIFEAATELSKVGKVSAYICGPPPLLSFAETELLKAALTKNQIKYENWY